MGARFAWSLLASALLNLFAWTAVAHHAALFKNAAQQPRESVIVMRSLRVTRRRTPIVPPETSVIPRAPASLSVPAGWDREDAGIGTTDVAMWLDWRKQQSKWIPRVSLWGMKLDPLYMQRPSLRVAIRDIVSQLRDDAQIFVSRAQRVCNGTRPGWFLSYVKTYDDPPLHFDETLFMAGGELYRAMYIRAADQPEDPRMREALNTLCKP